MEAGATGVTLMNAVLHVEAEEEEKQGSVTILGHKMEANFATLQMSDRSMRKDATIKHVVSDKY